VPSTSQLSVASSDTGLDEESEACDIKGQSGALTESVDQSEIVSQFNQCEIEPKEKVETPKDDIGLMMTCDSEYSSVEIGDIKDDNSEVSNLSKVVAGSQETLLSVKSLSPTHVAEEPTEMVAQDMNGNPEIAEPEVAFCQKENTERLIRENIGSPTEGVPIVYCVRVVCARFLLTGRKGELTPDRRVRVSLKTLAIGCVASAVKIYPSLFLEKLLVKTDGGGE